MAGVALALAESPGGHCWFRNWLLGYLQLRVPVWNPCHLSLHQTSVLLILVMKKLELREEKGFI